MSNQPLSKEEVVKKKQKKGHNKKFTPVPEPAAMSLNSEDNLNSLQHALLSMCVNDQNQDSGSDGTPPGTPIVDIHPPNTTLPVNSRRVRPPTKYPVAFSPRTMFYRQHCWEKHQFMMTQHRHFKQWCDKNGKPIPQVHCTLKFPVV